MLWKSSITHCNESFSAFLLLNQTCTCQNCSFLTSMIRLCWSHDLWPALTLSSIELIVKLCLGSWVVNVLPRDQRIRSLRTATVGVWRYWVSCTISEWLRFFFPPFEDPSILFTAYPNGSQRTWSLCQSILRHPFGDFGCKLIKEIVGILRKSSITLVKSFSESQGFFLFTSHEVSPLPLFPCFWLSH